MTVDKPVNQAIDTLFADSNKPGDFVFDDKVAAVFSDMINRSVPGYSTIISMIAVLAEKFSQENTLIYDLGCSLGAASMAIAKQLNSADYQIVAVDSSKAMVEKFRQALDQVDDELSIELRCEDILDTQITNASVVVLNFTLQFIPVPQRAKLLQRIYQGMTPGGILVLSEKIQFPDQNLDELFIGVYHSFKEKMGYSKLEISQKRTALENVLIPEPIDTHMQRLRQAGFTNTDVWFQCFNFASLVAFK